MGKRIKLEVCTYSLESLKMALASGAERSELCASPYEGGITPSAGTIRAACRIRGLEIFVMVRPRGGDFHYTEDEFEIMKEDVAFIKSCGADGIVTGILNTDGSVDMARTSELVRLAAPMGVTFHRAVDMTPDILKAVEDIVRCGCCRILTSGGRNTAVEGRENIRKMLERASGRIEIMAGSGINAANVSGFIEMGVDAVHMSGSSLKDSLMEFRNPEVSMGGISGISEYSVNFSDADKLTPVVALLRQEK